MQAAAILSGDQTINQATKLLPDAICDAVIAWCDWSLEPSGGEAGAVYVVKLLAQYPDVRVHNLQGYQRSLAEVFSMFGVPICESIVDPKSENSIPGKQAFLPKVAEVRAAGEAEKRRRGIIKANALSMKQERHRRNTAPKEGPLTPAEIARRKEQVAKLLKTRNMDA